MFHCQNIDDGFIVNNEVAFQEIVRDINVNIPIFLDDKEKEETIEEASNYLDEYSSIANPLTLKLVLIRTT